MEMTRKVQSQQEASATAQKSAMDKARQEADALIASARDKAQEYEEAAHKSSLQYQETHEAARKEEERLASLKEQANALAQQMRDARKAMEEQQEEGEEEVNLDADRKDEQIRMLSIQLKTMENRCMTLEGQLAEASKKGGKSGPHGGGRDVGPIDEMPEDSTRVSQQIMDVGNYFNGVLKECNNHPEFVTGFNQAIRGFVNRQFNEMIDRMHKILDEIKEG